MAQAFETTYKRYYRKYELDVRHSLPPIDRFAETLPESGNWLVIKSLEEQKESGLPLTEVENAVKAMYRKRLYSMYQLDYCSRDFPKEEFIAADTPENELVRSAGELYKTKDVPVLPTRPSARRVFGYLRPAYTLTPLTMYQRVHGIAAYKILKDGFPDEVCASKEGKFYTRQDEATTNNKNEEPKQIKENVLITKQNIESKPSFRRYNMKESPAHHNLLAGIHDKGCACCKDKGK